jgi:hypothetical protein
MSAIINTWENIHMVYPLSYEETQTVGVLPMVTPGGDRGIRTPDLRDANAALSRLSYIPVKTRLL